VGNLVSYAVYRNLAVTYTCFYTFWVRYNKIIFSIEKIIFNIKKIVQYNSMSLKNIQMYHLYCFLNATIVPLNMRRAVMMIYNAFFLQFKVLNLPTNFLCVVYAYHWWDQQKIGNGLQFYECTL